MKTPISQQCSTRIPAKSWPKFLVGIEPEGVGVSPDGSRVMVTSESTFMVHVITVPEHEVCGQRSGGAPGRAEVTFSADGKLAYVTSEISGQVSKLDVAANAVVQQVKLGPPQGPSPRALWSARTSRPCTSRPAAAT